MHRVAKYERKEAERTKKRMFTHELTPSEWLLSGIENIKPQLAELIEEKTGLTKSLKRTTVWREHQTCVEYVNMKIIELQEKLIKYQEWANDPVAFDLARKPPKRVENPNALLFAIQHKEPHPGIIDKGTSAMPKEARSHPKKNKVKAQASTEQKHRRSDWIKEFVADFSSEMRKALKEN